MKQLIEVDCSECGKKFELSEMQRYTYKKDPTKEFYCSVSCRNKRLCRKNTQERPKVNCCICGKEFILSNDQLHRYNKGEKDFYCSQSCIMQKSLKNIDRKKQGETFKKHYRENLTIKEKRKKAMEARGGNPFKNKEKIKQYWLDNYGVENPSQLKEIAIKKVISAKKSKAFDGTRFDSSYEKDVYEFAKRNNLLIERNVPLEYKYNGKKHITFIDFKIDGYLFECKGAHLLKGIFSDKLEVPINEKLEVYKQNHVIIITNQKGKEFIPEANSELSNGLKYLNKCPNPLIAIDIDLFRNPEVPYASDRPKCFYDVKVDRKLSVNEAWKNELIRWKMIKNRIEYTGGFIDNKQILTAMNVTRTCKQPSWFSKTYAKELIQKYITTTKILDPFAGWGARCDACKELGIDYLGGDFNKELIDWHKENNRNIIWKDANEFKSNEECSVFICPPYTDFETYFEGQDLKTTQCEWLSIVMRNIPNAKEYLMVCKVVDPGFEKYVVEEKINKSHFGTNKEYVILIKK